MVDNSDVQRPSEMCLIPTILLSIFNSIDFIGLISHHHDHYASSAKSVAPKISRHIQVREVLSIASVAFQRPLLFCQATKNLNLLTKIVAACGLIH